MSTPQSDSASTAEPFVNASLYSGHTLTNRLEAAVSNRRPYLHHGGGDWTDVKSACERDLA